MNKQKNTGNTSNTDNTNNTGNTNNTDVSKKGKTFATRMAIRRPDGLDGMFPAPNDNPPSPPAPATDTPPAPTQEPATGTRGKYANQTTTTRDGRKPVTYKLPVEVIDKTRAIAYWERVEQWQIVAQAIQGAIDAYERQHGPIEPVPEK